MHSAGRALHARAVLDAGTVLPTNPSQDENKEIAKSKLVFGRFQKYVR